ncbi:MAG: polyamine aminopropyltransferase [Sterolibacterium sp.]|nr:polyamine aminopropyltransferase [Sterolibacterium sp.]MBP9800181.1 polyamine aminopropyltransferase [Sterolibacterium sp.]
MQLALLASVFVVASCGLAYELIAGALASYLIGDSITQFSTVIGTYLFAMGIGSWLSGYVGRGMVARFIQIELLVGLLGGFSATFLFLVFAWLSAPFRPLLYLIVLLLGILVGMEIPLVMRILKRDLAFKDVVSQVLTFDYLGALLVSILFPLLLAPELGLIRTGLLFGLLNVGVALWAMHLFREHLPAGPGLRLQGTLAFAILLTGFVGAERLTNHAEQHVYADNIIFAKSTPYQRIVLTRWKDDLRLFLNNNLQFSSHDEYRYHEALIHPALASLPHARRVLVLGGGDGLAVREILKYPNIQQVTLVDLDAEMTRLFSTLPMLTELNGGALNDARVRVINTDAMRWLEEHSDVFDLIIVDFPDPSNFSIGKLYTSAFYRLLDRHIAPQGLAVIQSTSPLYARKSFWTVVNTLESIGLQTTPYHALVPSFGEWGFVIAGRSVYRPPAAYPVATRFLTPETTPQLFQFPRDMDRAGAGLLEINQLNNQVLVRTFEEEWHKVIR